MPNLETIRYAAMHRSENEDIAAVLQSLTFDKVIFAEIIDGGQSIGYVSRNLSNFKVIDGSHHPYDTPGVWPDDQLIPRPWVRTCGFYDCSEKDWVYIPFYFAQANCLPHHLEFYTRTHVHFTKEVKDYKFSCINRIPKLERIWFYSKLHQRPFYKDTIATFQNKHPDYDSKTLFIEGFDYDVEGASPETYYRRIDNETATYFKNVIHKTLPHTTEFDTDKNQVFLDRTINHPAFNNAYVNIISEHLYDKTFLSEKTVKPLASAQLFLMAGPRGAVKHLEDMGFDTYRDYIDHDHYDHEADWQTRLQKMLDVAEDLSDQDLHAINNETITRRERNREYLFSFEFRNVIFSQLNDWIYNNAPI